MTLSLQVDQLAQAVLSDLWVHVHLAGPVLQILHLFLQPLVLPAHPSLLAVHQVQVDRLVQVSQLLQVVLLVLPVQLVLLDLADPVTQVDLVDQLLQVIHVLH